jgi:hypothetical protein
MAPNDGGPAFPQTNEERYLDPQHGVIRPKDIYGDASSGMSLRDYFAAQCFSVLIVYEEGSTGSVEDFAGAARDAYRRADALLAEREKVRTS